MEQQKDQPKQLSESRSNELIEQVRVLGRLLGDMSIKFCALEKSALKAVLANSESLYLLSYSKCVFYRLKRERSSFIVRCYWSKRLGGEIKNLKMKHRTLMYIKSVLK